MKTAQRHGHGTSLLRDLGIAACRWSSSQQWSQHMPVLRPRLFRLAKRPCCPMDGSLEPLPTAQTHECVLLEAQAWYAELGYPQERGGGSISLRETCIAGKQTDGERGA